ncbi:hypothetical protein AWENTII_008196 [Aspergillus wentii]|nr:hypothetical protein MW887_002507 [Aspergillus wentii]
MSLPSPIQEPAVTTTLTNKTAITAWERTDEHLAIATEGGIYIYRFSDNTLNTLQLKGNATWSLAWWGDENALVTGGSDSNIRIWDIDTKSIIRTLKGHSSTVRCLQIINGKTLISGSRDTTIRIWDLTSPSPEPILVLEGHSATVKCVQAHEDLLVSGSYDHDARIWNIHTGECLHVLKGHQGQIFELQFDGTRIVTGSFDTEIRVWDPKSGSCLAILSGHKDLITHLDLQANNLISADCVGMLRRWSLEGTDNTELTPADNDSVISLATHKDHVLLGKANGSVRLVNRNSGETRTLLDSGGTVWKVGFTPWYRPMAVYTKGAETRLSVFTG